MSQNSDDQVQHQAAVTAGREAASILAAADASYFAPRREKLLKDAFAAIDDGSLTSETARSVLFQLYEHHRLTKDLKKLVKAGLRATEKISSSM